MILNKNVIYSIGKNSTEQNLQNELAIIFEYYRDKFKLEVMLYFDMKNMNTCFNCGGYININGKEIGKTYYGNKDKDRHEYHNIRELAIIFLLHEIGHAIDYKYNKNRYIKEYYQQRRDISISKIKDKYWNFPLEKRADYFANNEKKKWV